MNKIIKFILSITGLMVLVTLYKEIKPLVKILFCDHVYQTWDMRLDASESEKLKNLHGHVFKDAYRKCVKCEKQAEYLSMIPGNFKWKKTYQNLDKNTKVIDVEVFGFDEETKQNRRNRIINSILK